VLKAKTALDGYSAEINDVSIREIESLDIISLAVPTGGEKQISTALKNQFGLAMPKSGKFSSASRGDAQLLWMSQDQFFLLRPETTSNPAHAVAELLNNRAYVTDQSDSYAILEVSGNRALEALERICPVNLHEDEFKIGSIARTMMEHLGVVIMKTETNKWTLMSSRSSAHSFLHAIEASAKNI